MKSLYLWIWNFLGVGGPSGKIFEIPGGGGNNVKPSGAENPAGWGLKLKKPSVEGGMDIFWNHTMLQKLG